MNKKIACIGLLRREIKRYLKVPLQTLSSPVVNSILYLLIFGVSLGEIVVLKGEVSYLAFLIPGLIAMSLVRNAFENSTSAIIAQKYTNELQDLRTSPLTKGVICIAKGIGSLTRGLLVGGITLGVGEVFYFLEKGRWLPICYPGELVFFMIFGGLGFANLGVAVGMWARSFEHVGAISMLLLLPLIYLGGVFFDAGSIDPLWQLASRFNPLFYLIDGVRHAILGHSVVSWQFAALFTFLFFMVCYSLSWVSLKKGFRYLR